MGRSHNSRRGIRESRTWGAAANDRINAAHADETWKTYCMADTDELDEDYYDVAPMQPSVTSRRRRRNRAPSPLEAEALRLEAMAIEQWLSPHGRELVLLAAQPWIPTSHEIAGSVLFYASDLSRGVTGTALDVNGGHWISL